MTRCYRCIGIVLYGLILTAAPQAFASMKVPVEGVLTTTNSDPEKGEICIFSLNVTALLETPLKLKFHLPEKVKLVEGESLEKTFDKVQKNQTVRHDVKVRVLSSEPMKIIADAILADSPGLKMVKGFEIELNATANTPPKATWKEGVSGDGTPLIIFDSAP